MALTDAQMVFDLLTTAYSTGCAPGCALPIVDRRQRLHPTIGPLPDGLQEKFSQWREHYQQTDYVDPFWAALRPTGIMSDICSQCGINPASEFSDSGICGDCNKNNDMKEAYGD